MAVIPIRLEPCHWRRAEYGAGLRGALGWVSQAAAASWVQQWFESSFGRPALVLNSGSSALQMALEALAVQAPQRREVILPALACPALTRATLAASLTPRYVDIAEDLNSPSDLIAQAITPNTLAVVMVHAYGHRADVEGTAALCQSAGVALIDDAAQRIDPASGLGTHGSFGVFSFAQSKSVVTGIEGSGGVLLVNDESLLAPLQQRWQGLKPASGRTWPWIEFTLNNCWPAAAYWVERLRPAARDGGLAGIGRIDAAIAEPQLRSLSQRTLARQHLLACYRDTLAAHGVAAPQLGAQALPPYLARLLVQLKQGAREACRAQLKQHGVATRLPYQLPKQLDKTHAPIAHARSQDLLELPLPQAWDAQLVNRVVQLIQPFCAGREPLAGKPPYPINPTDPVLATGAS